MFSDRTRASIRDDRREIRVNRTAADEQRQRECDLRHDQGLANARLPTELGVDRVCLSGGGGEIGAPRLRRRQRRGDHAGHRQRPTTARSTRSGPGMFSTRGRLGGASGMNAATAMAASADRRRARPTSESGMIPPSTAAPPAGATRRARAAPRLAAARGRARRQQPDRFNIATSSRDRRRAEHHIQRAPHLAEQIGVRAQLLHANALVLDRRPLSARQLRSSRFARPSIVTPGFSRATLRSLFGGIFRVSSRGIDGERHPRLISRSGYGKFAAHHAHDPVRRAGQADAAADDRRIGAESATPQRVAQQHHPVVADLVFLFGEAPSEHRRDAQHRQ